MLVLQSFYKFLVHSYDFRKICWPDVRRGNCLQRGNRLRRGNRFKIGILRRGNRFKIGILLHFLIDLTKHIYIELLY